LQALSLLLFFGNTHHLEQLALNISSAPHEQDQQQQQLLLLLLLQDSLL
jgi:hypothetical protein